MSSIRHYVFNTQSESNKRWVGEHSIKFTYLLMIKYDHYKFQLQWSSTGFLDVFTTNILGQIIICVCSCPVHYSIFSIISASAH